MNNISTRNLYTDRLELRIPSMEEQHRLWEILQDENVNQYYFPTPDRIFRKYNLSKDSIEDLKTARRIFLEEFSDWERQKPFYEKKIQSIHDQDDSQRFTWSIFLRDTNVVIGQITCQPKDNEPPETRDVGWFIDPKFQGNGYGTEAAVAMLDFMFDEVGIEKIKTSAAEINSGSWGIMKKLGFQFVGTKKSTYYKDDEILTELEYHGDKELFFNRNNGIKKH